MNSIITWNNNVTEDRPVRPLNQQPVCYEILGSRAFNQASEATYGGS